MRPEQEALLRAQLYQQNPVAPGAALGEAMATGLQEQQVAGAKTNAFLGGLGAALLGPAALKLIPISTGVKAVHAPPAPLLRGRAGMSAEQQRQLEGQLQRARPSADLEALLEQPRWVPPRAMFGGA